MIAGLCESPLTFQAIIIWRDELVEGRVLLRDIIDLEATYAGPDGKGAPRPRRSRRRRRRGGRRAPMPRRAIAPPEGDLDDDDIENNVSLSAMEAELKPRVLETFDRIADNYKKLRRLQVEHVEQRHAEQAAHARPGAQVQEAEGRHRRRREVAVAQQQPHRGAGRAALRHQQAPDLARGPPDAPRRAPRRRPRRVPQALPGLGARPEMGAAGLQARRPRLEGLRRQGARTTSRSCASRSTSSPPRPAWRSRSSAASSRWCRRASARRARRRRR